MATEQYYIWSEMVMVQNTYGTKWFLVMVRNCNFVVRNGILWNEMVMVVISYHNHFVTAISYHSENHFRTICRSIHYYHFVPYADRNIMTIMKYNFTVTEEVEYKHAQISGMTAQ
jgi:hypothetical protein